MIKRILPIYHTGWFYLLLLFWGFSFWYVSIGGLNQVNQLNINALAQLTSTPTLPKNKPTSEATEILTLYSSFDEHEIDSISTILSSHPQSQITLLGTPSRKFMTRLESYLATSPRKNKIVIAANNSWSKQKLNTPSSTLYTSTLAWFRYSAHNLKQTRSEHFIYSPFLINKRQSFPILWQQQEEVYLSLVGEILRQLSVNTELSLNQSWQLSLTNTDNEQVTKKLSLGFFGEIFTSGAAYSIQQTAQDKQGNKGIAAQELTSVKAFVAQGISKAVSAVPTPLYKVIIITDHKQFQHKMVLGVLKELLQQDYLSQKLSTILLCWALFVIALSLAWFIRCMPMKQQLLSIVSYCLVLFIIQFFMFKQHQWLEVLPVVFFLAGSWLLLFAYQKECQLFLSALKGQTAQLNSTARATAIVDKGQSLSNQQVKIATTGNMQVPLSVDTTPMLEEELQQTLVILDKPRQTSTKHHLTVASFGRYQVEGILGKGAMGIVYQGVDPKINRHVAIKTLQLSDDIDSAGFIEAKERFFREAQTAGGLSHANIVTIYDVGEEQNLGYIAMDLLTGAPLSLFTQPGQTLPTPLVYQLLIQIADALDYAHKQNVVHRDIKPANIIYDDDLLKVTVTDFGIAYVSDNSKTRTGIIMGSPYYMSPEQILGLKVDGRSDIFSLGVTFYQLLCGYLPFEGESIATVAYQITKAKAIAVNQRNTALPTSALRICSKAMHKDITKRYQTMAEFKLALANALKRDFKISAN
ncbi:MULTISPECIES: serine/threonine-protein kinase [Colwellia]|uniref:Serine/threonine protein kinase n=1 Tax=Colwellia marinimaniae TaxID=1513592 RepID=A0ABQ0MSQ7_9GAMM|nr:MULTISPECIES: serine/threonine-protein kinase [Colwellia]GAW95389.1 serine/threonine protein kinase [Colwellia marinimaniae]